MKILLVGVNAKYIHSNPAIYSLAAYAGKKGLLPYISLAEFTINQQEELVLAEIYEKQPDVIAFSCYIWNITMIYTLLEDLHRVLPETDLWLGGPEVSFDPEQQLQKFPYLKGIMIGEGEETFRELTECYVRGNGRKELEFHGIPGLYLTDGYTEERKCMDMDEIPFFYTSNLGDSYHGLSDFENRIVYYESSRGCPFRCSYCLSSIEKKLRFRSLALVQEELLYFIEHRVPQVKFIDRTFNASHNHCMAIWTFIKEHDNGITNFHFEISADLLTGDEISLLQSMREGLVQLEIGVQTTNEKTIQAILRRTDISTLQRHVEAVNQGGNIHQHLDLIAGLPYEDYESFHRSFNDVYRMQPQQLQLGFLKVLKGSRMMEMAEEYGLVYHNIPPYEVLYTKWLSFADVLRLKEIEEMVELFYNSRQFTHAISYLEYLYGDAFRMFEELAAFYKKRRLILASKKRIFHYENFLRFIEEKYPEETGLFKELLLFDCYLRENMKSYPEFAKNHEAVKLKDFKEDEKSLSRYEKDFCRNFYQTEEAERKQLPNHKQYDSKQMAKMTHLEFFRFPVWEKDFSVLRKAYKECSEEDMEQALKPVLFDYTDWHYTTSFCRTVLL